MLCVLKASSKIEHRLNHTVHTVLLADFTTQVDVINTEEYISVQLLVVITLSANLNRGFCVGVDFCNDAFYRINLFGFDVLVNEHLIGKVVCFNSVEVVKHKLCNPESRKERSYRRADRTTSDDVALALNIYGVEIFDAFC